VVCFLFERAENARGDDMYGVLRAMYDANAMSVDAGVACDEREIYNSSVGRKNHRVQVARRIFEQGMGRLS